MTTRVSPPAKGLGPNPCTVNGRTYSVAVGSTQDVPDQDASVLSANGWHSHSQVVATVARPMTAVGANPVWPKGTPLIDSTLNAVIFFDGSQWRNWLTGALV